MAWRERMSVNPSRMEIELAQKLQAAHINHRTQVDIPVTCVDFMIPRDGKRPLLVYVDGRPHFSPTQSEKDEEVRSLLRKKGYEILELRYMNYSQKALDGFYMEILEALGKA